MNDENIKKYFENMVTWLDENFYGQSLYLILSEKVHMTDEDIREFSIDSLESYLKEKESISTKTALDDFNDMMKNEVEYIIDQMKAESVNGYYSVNLNDYNSAQGAQISIPLLVDMLEENELVDSVEIKDDSLVIYSQTLDESETVESAKREISQEDVDIMLAKHTLWLNDAGGEQADFSNCILTRLNFSGKNMINAILENAEFCGCNFQNAEMCFSVCNNTKFETCDMSEVMAEESEFKNSVFDNCSLQRAVFTHSDFTDAKFLSTRMDYAELSNSCLENIQSTNTNFVQANMDNVSYDEDEWVQDGENFDNGICQSM